MKKLFTFLTVFVLGTVLNQSFAQLPTPLYAGYRNLAQVDEIDTTGGVFSIVGSVPVTSDFGAVSGIFGIATDPTDEQMYCLYQSTGGANARRLGYYDPVVGEITDIGNSGNMTDIDFASDGTLYASGGWSGSTDMDLWEVDKATGVSSLLFVSAVSNWGSSISYDPFNDELYMIQAGSAFSTIDPGTLVETVVGGASTPTDMSAMVVINDNTAWAFANNNLYEVNTTTGVATLSGTYDQYHSLGFGPLPCNPLDITVSATEACEGDEFTLTATGAGTITWDGGITDGVPFVPGVPGTYEYTPTSDDPDDCPVTEPIVIEVIGLPTVVAGAGDLNFCDGEPIVLSASGDAHIYEWNDGEPLDLNPGVGTHTYSLWGAYTSGGCLGENTDEVTVTVHELPTITASADADPICIGDEVTVTGAGGESYVWEDGIEDGVAFAPNVIGTTTYTVTGTDINGCTGTADVDVTVVDLISITYTVTEETLGGDGEIDIEVTGGAPAFSFDWDNDGTGDFDDDEDLTGLAAGTYTVVVTGEAGCEATETIILGSQVGIEELAAGSVALYPNPTSDILNIELEGSFNYELTAINGDVIVKGIGNTKETISLSEYADGVYFITINTTTGAATLKVVKK